MRFLRGTRNSKTFPASLKKELTKDRDNLFQLWIDNEEDFAQVEIVITTMQRNFNIGSHAWGWRTSGQVLESLDHDEEAAAEYYTWADEVGWSKAHPMSAKKKLYWAFVKEEAEGRREQIEESGTEMRVGLDQATARELDRENPLFAHSKVGLIHGMKEGAERKALGELNGAKVVKRPKTSTNHTDPNAEGEPTARDKCIDAAATCATELTGARKLLGQAETLAEPDAKAIEDFNKAIKFYENAYKTLRAFETDDRGDDWYQVCPIETEVSEWKVRVVKLTRAFWAPCKTPVFNVL